MDNQDNTNRILKLGFVGAVYAFMIVMMGTTLPTPLYPLYSNVFQLSPLMITVIYAVYAVGVIGGLLVFGQLSDRIGRRYVLIPGIILSIISAIVFLFASNVGLLLLGRVVSGLSAGLFTSTATTTIVNLAPDDKKNQASTIASSVNMLGLGFGPLLCGVLAQYLPYALHLVFIVDIVLLIPAFIGIWLMPEPIKDKQSFRIKVQKLSVPSNIRGTFIYAVIPVFVGFSMLGLFTAISPNFLGEILNIQNKAIIGLTVFLVFCASTVGQLLFKQKSDYSVLMLGSATLIVGVILVGISLLLSSYVLLLIGAIVSGLGQAFSFRAGLSTVNSVSPQDKQAEITSTFFTIAYIAISIPVVGVGLLQLGLAIQGAGLTFSIIVVLLAIISLVLLLLNHKNTQQE
ncbi:MFS transporter [Staphylococcus kloosii]|uniref:MFS transporter n=1 Tax=Staphylococcus kloosii TaxID=29384 RepID=A0ABQ0XIJ0_9STAP|nr:MFS transporter [Staphylococcus kloosii]GEP81277.1 MFS transporter [Staphylococcus kloosii]SUM47966.1 putative major facilitator superfamily permease [Staphylococcus kloosii]